ncbi:MAG: orotidine 5'-phosphate decarboxylase / HUMPS family protein [Desulfomonilaceae bacterium]
MKEFAIIAALDLDTSALVLEIAAKIAKTVDGIKIGVPTLLESGTGIIARVRELLDDKPLLVDLKIADIGFRSPKSWSGTNAKILAKLGGCGVSHVTVHGFPGPSSVAEAVDIGNEFGIGALLLPMMSHIGAETFFSGSLDVAQFERSCRNSGIDPNSVEKSPLRDVTDGILAIGEAIGVSGYIGPATRPEDLRRYRLLTQKPIWCPGFGRQDRLGRSLAVQLRDWADIVGSRSAAIVGSSIYNAHDPYAAAIEMIEIRDAVTGEISK